MNVVNVMRLASLSILIALMSCTPKNLKPTDQQIANANYGEAPDVSEIPVMVRQYLKRSGYYDPNGAEIEGCTEPERGWVKNLDYEIHADFLFGWKTQCDVNGKNRMGGFVGFQAIEYVILDDKVIAGRWPTTASSGGPIFTPDSKPVIWGN
ncbi:MAG: hypothetical protein KDD66_17775 [Bdellovibrionales bacterium]|nr:hypothetical protein [Bdellovibrionales bacterium]